MIYLSTGQASKALAVTPDTVLKWIKQGKLSAVRTAGGHYRIPESVVVNFLNQVEPPPLEPEASVPKNGLLYCWEFFAASGKLRKECQDCLVYRAQALKCYEMNHLPKESGFKGGGPKGSCEQCAYFHHQLGRPFNLLVITDNEECRESLSKEKGSERFSLQFANCEYECSLLVERFRPDFVVVDCGMQEEKCRELCHHLANDPRLQSTLIVLATPARRLSISFPGTLRIRNPFTLKDLDTYLAKNQVCRSIQNHQFFPRGGDN